ncbi:hypothetical protein PYX08_24475 [Citrobacter freundii]|nr:hypothetical protein [Citrobacter freundii]
MMNIVQEHTLNAELWIDDIFVRQGLMNILADIIFEDDNARLVFFTANHFEAVKKAKLQSENASSGIAD